VDKERKRAVAFGGRLREVREKAGESLRKVEKRSGLNNGYLSQLENGKILHPSPSVLHKVATGYKLRFEDVLAWAGYTAETSAEVTPNQAVALSTVSALGNPSDEELKALNAIVELLQRNRTAPFAAPSDLPLEPEAVWEVRRYAVALLREADALGRRPTPLNDIQAAARLVSSGELALDPRDRARLVERFGRWVELAWRRLQGTLDFRSSAIWVKPDLHPMKHRFVLSHEIGHAILPAHKAFAYVDDYTRMPPFARDLYEREANQAAVEILFQGGQLTDEFDAVPPSLREICDLSTEFGGSVVAASRYAVETSQRALAVAIAHRGNDGRLGATHVYYSKRFEQTYRWEAGRAPWSEIRAALRTATAETDETWAVQDSRGEPTVVNATKMDTGFAAIVLVVPESRKRWRPPTILSDAGGTARLIN
jgi:transcriptional regulator with XRE-family HTH domain